MEYVEPWFPIHSEKRIRASSLRGFMRVNGIDVKHCARCGNKGTKKNPLTIHHKNGDPRDNRLENLEIIHLKKHQEIDGNIPKNRKKQKKKKPRGGLGSVGKNFHLTNTTERQLFPFEYFMKSRGEVNILE